VGQLSIQMMSCLTMESLIIEMVHLLLMEVSRSKEIITLTN
jgi:hypothetical protein